MESKSETLKQLENLYQQAKTPSERAILLQTMRIVSPEECKRLEEVLQREQVRSLPVEELIALVAKQKGMPAGDARRAIADLVFDQMLDRSKLTMLDSSILSQAPAPAPSPAANPAPSPSPRPAPPKPFPPIPRVQILEPPSAAHPEEKPSSGPSEAAPSRGTGSFIMPRGIPAE